MGEKRNMKKLNKQIIFAAILLLYPFRHVQQGLDLMDASYSLGHFQFRDNMDLMWKIATFLSNWFGMMLTKLPFGNTWIGMNVYTSLLIGLVAVVIYSWCCKQYPGHDVILFLAELFALSMTWAPSTVLYHYLGYFLFSITAIVLFEAIRICQKRLFLVSGVILGLCILVRMPNITYAALIVSVWYGAYLWKDDKGRMHVVQQTLYCLAGYMIGFVPGVLWMSIKYGIDAYPNMIQSLFSMTDTATDYKPVSMINAMFYDYSHYSVWLLIFVIYLIAGILVFHVLEKKKNTCCILNITKILFCAGMIVVIRFCYGRGMFGIQYRDFFSMYKWVTVYLLCVIISCVYMILSRKVQREEKLLASILLVIIFITPLGSNNGLYPVMNNLFLIAPVSFYFFYSIYQKYNHHFAVKTWIPFLMACLYVQVTLFGMLFVFHDNDLPKRRIKIEGFSTTDGMVTNVEKAEALEGLGVYLSDKKEKKVVLYGNIPGISYIYDLQPAVFTAWADLDSNGVQKLSRELGSVDVNSTLVILSKEIADKFMQSKQPELTQKEQILLEYMNENAYQAVYQNEMFTVYEQNAYQAVMQD